MFRSNNNLQIEAYNNVDWAKHITDRKSTSSYYSFIGGNLVIWRSKKESTVARSNVEV